MADFRCPSCGCGRTQVADSRPASDSRIRRTRFCRCGHRFRTMEIHTDEYHLMNADMLAEMRDQAYAMANTIGHAAEMARHPARDDAL